MSKMPAVNQKNPTKEPKSCTTKKKSKMQQPLKVVYITNPMKFKATTSEFRSLVQQLTGQDSELPESAKISADEGVGGGPIEAVKTVAADGAAHALGPYSGSSTYSENGSDPSMGFWSYDENVCYSPQSNFPELVGSWHEADDDDELKGFGAM